MNCCEDVGILKSIASFGIDFFRQNRMVVMVICDILVVLSFMLICAAMAGGSTDEDNVKDAAWTIAKINKKNGGGTIYYGTKMVVFRGTDTEWKDCKGSDTCGDCEDAGQTALNCSVLMFLLMISLFVSSISRTRQLWDMVLHKIAALVVCALSLLIMIIGMGAWNDQCASKLEGDVKGATFELGPGLNSMVAAFFFVLFAMVIHILVPVEGGSAESDSDGNFKPHDPERNQV